MALPSQFARRGAEFITPDENSPEDIMDIEVKPELDEYDAYALETEEGGVAEPAERAHDDNIAEFIDESALEGLASELMENYEKDVESRSDWQDIMAQGVDLLGFKMEERSTPFAGACGVTHPLLAQAVVKFQAKAYKELLPPGGPVK